MRHPSIPARRRCHSHDGVEADGGVLATWQNGVNAATSLVVGCSISARIAARDVGFLAPAATSASENHMSKRGRKKKSRKKNGANHGNRPNS
jgi:hypothetical protein